MEKNIQCAKCDPIGDEVENATGYFCNGAYCSQAVLLAFCDKYGLDDDIATKISCGLNSGARHANICGSASGAVLVIGLKYGHSNDICNLKVEEFMRLFSEKMCGITCRDILRCDISTPEGMAKASKEGLFGTVCVDTVSCAARILKDQGY
jgi:C_GCAxxG_C_C family probable redox protein